MEKRTLRRQSGQQRSERLTGNGNGTFQAKVNYVTESEPVSVSVGDFNNDAGQISPSPIMRATASACCWATGMAHFKRQ
jgi:hypothetical protein